MRRAGELILVSELEEAMGHEAQEVSGDRPFRMGPQTGLPATNIETLRSRASPRGMGQAGVWSDFSRSSLTGWGLGGAEEIERAVLIAHQDLDGP